MAGVSQTDICGAGRRGEGGPGGHDCGSSEIDETIIQHHCESYRIEMNESSILMIVLQVSYFSGALIDDDVAC